MLEYALSETKNLAGVSSADAEKHLTLYDADLPAGFAESAEPVLISIGKDIAALALMLDIKARHRSQTRAVRALLTAEAREIG